MTKGTTKAKRERAAGGEWWREGRGNQREARRMKGGHREKGKFENGQRKKKRYEEREKSNTERVKGKGAESMRYHIRNDSFPQSPTPKRDPTGPS